MRICGIYKIQSKKKSKRIYIGSSVHILDRWGNHIYKLRSNKHENHLLQNHFNRYGINDLQFTILLGCERKDLKDIEEFFINSFNPYFNLDRFSSNCSGLKPPHKIKIKFI